MRISTIFSALLVLICMVKASLKANPTGYNNLTICNYDTAIIDPNRPSHRIPMLIYYPCNRLHKYPYMIFGHAAESQDTWYDYIWRGMVPQGYICIFLGSYEYVGNQKDFARDQRYTNDWVRDTCANDPDCPLYQIVVNKSIISGMSMGGGAAMLSAGNYSLGESFNHSFDAFMTLSGCGGSDTHKSMKQNKIPSIIMSGSHDCICPATVDADKYYDDVPDTTCKYLAIITNGTHCHFGQEGYIGPVADDLCQKDEAGSCHGIVYQKNIPEKTQHDIVIEYYSSFMFATLYENNDKQAMSAVSTQLTNDKASGVMYNIGVGC
eukprot:189590_1